MASEPSPHGAPVDGVLDARELRKSDRHASIFAAYDDLALHESFVLVNDHDPQPLRDQFERDYGPGFGWEYKSTESGNWRIRITKQAATALPRVLADANDLAAGVGEADAMGAVFSLRMRQRDLDSNVIALSPGGGIAEHAGPEVDVLIHVIAGSGELTTETGPIPLEAGSLLWLPRRSRRAFNAGPQGMRYLTVHRKRESLKLHSTRPAGSP